MSHLIRRSPTQLSLALVISYSVYWLWKFTTGLTVCLPVSRAEQGQVGNIRPDTNQDTSQTATAPNAPGRKCRFHPPIDKNAQAHLTKQVRRLGLQNPTTSNAPSARPNSGSYTQPVARIPPSRLAGTDNL